MGLHKPENLPTAMYLTSAPARIFFLGRALSCLRLIKMVLQIQHTISESKHKDDSLQLRKHLVSSLIDWHKRQLSDSKMRTGAVCENMYSGRWSGNYEFEMKRTRCSWTSKLRLAMSRPKSFPSIGSNHITMKNPPHLARKLFLCPYIYVTENHFHILLDFQF